MWELLEDGTFSFNNGEAILNETTPVYISIYEDGTVFVSNDAEADIGDISPKKGQSFFGGNALALDIWKMKYAQKGENNPTKTFSRIINELDRVENKYTNRIPKEKLEELITDFKYIVPAGSIIYGIGTKEQVSLANCFVIDGPSDSYGGIYRADQEQIQLMKRRGGVGHDLSRLRAKGTRVKNAAKTSTGLISFAEQYSDSTGRCAQDARRGALMLTIEDTHPEVFNFINAKTDLNKINNANISVKISDETMYYEKTRMGLNVGKPVVVMEDNGWGIPIPNKKPYKYGLVSDSIIEAIAKSMHKSAEPGILFWDRILMESPADCYDNFKTVCTNPCGEVPLAPYDSCRLLHVNLFSHVLDPFTNHSEFDFDTFSKNVGYAQRILDDIIDLEEEKIISIIDKVKSDPESEEEKSVELNLWNKVLTKLRNGRRTGLGITGLADTFAALGHTYGSEKSIHIAEEIIKELAISSYKESIKMAYERGAFPAFNHTKEHNHPFIERILSLIDDERTYTEMYAKFGRRNIANMAIAPTGTISLLTRTSSGIEPVFDIVHYRTIKNYQSVGVQAEPKQVLVVHDPFKLWYNTVILPKTNIEFNTLTIDQIKELVKDSPYNKSIAHEVDPYKKISLQGRIQKYIDHSISVTCNAPMKTTVEEIKKMIVAAHEEGCKGFTFYRDGSRSGILSSYKEEFTKKGFSKNDAINRPAQLDAYVDIVTVAGQKIGIAIGMIGDVPYEVFSFNVTGEMADIIKNDMVAPVIVKMKSKKYNLLWRKKSDANVASYESMPSFNEKTSPDAELVCRLISIALRHGVDINFIYEQIHKPNADVNNFAKAVSRTFKKFLKNETLSRKGDVCPHCGVEIKFIEGCATCIACGLFSKC